MEDKKFQKGKRDVKKIYTPETLKRNLINASLILTAYELMKYSLIDQLKNFFDMHEKSHQKHKNEIEQLRNKLPKKLRRFHLLV